MALNPKNRKLDKNGNPIVTKEELKASGMSLRDFLNEERGLTRRGGGKPETADAAEQKAASTKTNYAPSAKTGSPLRVTEDELGIGDKAKAKMTTKDLKDMRANRNRSMGMSREELMKSVNMKSGGSVRGDGCAVKGKTKGTMR